MFFGRSKSSPLNKLIMPPGPNMTGSCSVGDALRDFVFERKSCRSSNHSCKLGLQQLCVLDESVWFISSKISSRVKIPASI